MDFQKLSQSVPRGETTDQTYETLLESSMSAVFADAAWLEAHDEEGVRQIIRNLKDEEVDDIKTKIESPTIKEVVKFPLSSVT